MSDNSSGWEFSAGFFIGGLVGGLVGAAAAILMAPQAGEETRAILRDKSIELKERANDATLDARRRAEEATADARERASQMRESAKLTLDEKMAQVKDAIDTGKAAADKKKDEMMQSLKNDTSAKSA